VAVHRASHDVGGLRPDEAPDAGPRRSHRRPTPVDVALLALPVAGAIGTELLPHRQLIDRHVAAVMIYIATINAVGEELLWRGTFLAQFPGDLVPRPATFALNAAPETATPVATCPTE
jgi:hypothetical protein